MHSRTKRSVFIFFKAAIILIVCAQLLRGALFVADHPVPFDADEAHHASRGLDVYQAVISGDGVWRSIRTQSFYPPLHSFVVASSYLLSAGPGLTSSRICSLAPLIIGLVLLYATTARTTRRIAGPDSGAESIAPLFAIVLAASSPLIFANSLLSMPESLGFCLSALLLDVVTRIESQGAPRLRSLLCLAAIAGALSLTKYAYGFFTVPALVAALVVWKPESHRSLRAPTLFLISFTAILSLWCLATNSESLWHYLFGHKERSLIFSAQKLIFCPSAFLSEGVLHPVIGALVVGLGAVACFRYHSMLSILVALFAALAPHVILGVSEEQGSRHIIPSLAFVWYLASIGLVSIGAHLSQRLKSFVQLFAVIFLSLYFLLSTPRLLAFTERMLETNNDYLAISDDMVRQLGCQHPILMLGRGDGFSAQWVRWYVAVQCKLKLVDVVVDPYPFSPTAYNKARRTGAPIARAYLDPAFPQEPLADVLNTGYYRGLIAFSQRNDPGEFKKLDLPEIKERIPSYLSEHGPRRLLIMPLPQHFQDSMDRSLSTR